MPKAFCSNVNIELSLEYTQIGQVKWILIQIFRLQFLPKFFGPYEKVATVSLKISAQIFKTCTFFDIFSVIFILVQIIPIQSIEVFE